MKLYIKSVQYRSKLIPRMGGGLTPFPQLFCFMYK